VGYDATVTTCQQGCTEDTNSAVVVSIIDGTAGLAQAVPGSSSDIYLEGVACAPGGSSCVAVGQKLVVPISNGAPGAAELVADNLHGISCLDASGCVAVGDNASASPSGVIMPIALGGTPGSARTEPGTAVLYGVACADLSNCLAVGTADSQSGAIVQIATALSPGRALTSVLSVTGAASTITALLRSGAYPAAFTAPAAGTAQISWYYTPSGARAARVAGPVLVAQGSSNFAAAGRATIEVKLTPRGLALLKKAERLKLTARGRFTVKGGKTTTEQTTITLKR
jgi:hypothetical protein